MGIFSRLTRDRKYTRYGNVSPFLPHRVVATRVAPRCLRAPHEPRKHLCHRVPSVAGSGFLNVTQALLPVFYAWNASAMAQAGVPVPLTMLFRFLF
jgi:hypothetical protein